MLLKQYRMHPSLAEFSNRQFYGGRIQDGVTALQRPAPAFPFPAADHPLCFVDVEISVEQTNQDGNKYNL